MADRLVEIQLADDQVIWARVESASGVTDVGLTRALSLSGFTELLRGVATSARKTLAEVGPDETSLEFGVEIAVAQGGAVAALAGLNGKASMKVTMKWVADQTAPTP